MVRSVTGLNWSFAKLLCLGKPAKYLSLTFEQFYKSFFSIKNIVIHQNVHHHTFIKVDLWPFIFPRWRPQWLGLTALIIQSDQLPLTACIIQSDQLPSNIPHHTEQPVHTNSPHPTEKPAPSNGPYPTEPPVPSDSPHHTSPLVPSNSPHHTE